MQASKKTLELRIKEKRVLGAQLYLLVLSPDGAERLPECQAGQFVQVMPPGRLTLLRRPISICHYIEEKQELWLLIAAIGRGTRAICEREVGETLSVILPLGNTFAERAPERPLLVGGGVGTAPMLYLAHSLVARGIQPTILLGGRSSEHIVLKEEFSQLGELLITTDDGSLGVAGRVTDHPYIQSGDYDAIYCCGPEPMMRAVAQLAERRGIYCEVSLENTMACGIGACLCCVQDTHEEGNVCVCTEGPVFPSTAIKW